jgi:hypothetical protein
VHPGSTDLPGPRGLQLLAERATGIEPAFPAWEVEPGDLADQHQSANVQVRPFSRPSVSSRFAVVVLRYGTDMACPGTNAPSPPGRGRLRSTGCSRPQSDRPAANYKTTTSPSQARPRPRSRHPDAEGPPAHDRSRVIERHIEDAVAARRRRRYGTVRLTAYRRGADAADKTVEDGV